MNAGDVISAIIDRFRQSIGWNLKEESVKDRADLNLSFIEVLGAGGVPVNKYEVSYRQARIIRAQKEADGKSVPFHITPEEILAGWYAIQKKAAETKENEADKDAAICSNRHNHIDGETLVAYHAVGRGEVILPCHVCRPSAYKQRRMADQDAHVAELAKRRLKAAPASVTHHAHTPTVEKAQPQIAVGEMCKNGGNEISGAVFRLSPDFAICAKCKREIEELREKEQNKKGEKIKK